MKFTIEKTQSIIEHLEQPISAKDKREMSTFVKEILSFAIEGIGNAFSDEQKANIKKKFIKEANSSKTYLQSLHCIMALIERCKKFPNLASKYDEYVLKTAKLFNNTPEHILKIFEYAKGMQIKSGQQTIEDNHKTATSALISLAKLLNENGIKYHIVGAVPCYLQVYEQLIRYHDDIDIIVDDKDIDKIVALAKKSPLFSEFTIKDKRKHSSEILLGYDEMGKPITQNHNPHQAMFQHKKSEFHIGFFQYEKKKDGKLYMKSYYMDEKTKKPVVYYPYSLTEEDFESEYGETLTIQDENGKDIEIPCSSVKAVYNKKDSEREKDQFDRQMFEEYIKNNTNKFNV